MNLQELFGISHGIVQAPMAGASNANLVSAVSHAGGLGSLGAAALKPKALREHIQAIRQQTDRPFNINLFAPASELFDEASQMGPGLADLMLQYHKEFGLGPPPDPGAIFGPAEEQLSVLIEERVPVISFHFGIEATHVEQIHSAGLKVICSATTVSEARALASLGVDAIIAQGGEAGGHRGTFLEQGNYQSALIGTMALVPSIVDAVDIPVIAAGGIMDARGIIACRALGAAGVQMGTAFLGCPEAGIPEVWLEKLLESDPEATTVTTAMSGKPARGIRNRYISELEALNEDLLPYPLQYSISGPLRSAALKKGGADFLAMWSGQGVGLIRQLPAAELMAELIEESEVLAKNLCG
jgi:nitronate monooxygenase